MIGGNEIVTCNIESRREKVRLTISAVSSRPARWTDAVWLTVIRASVTAFQTPATIFTCTIVTTLNSGFSTLITNKPTITVTVGSRPNRKKVKAVAINTLVVASAAVHHCKRQNNHFKRRTFTRFIPSRCIGGQTNLESSPNNALVTSFPVRP